jgi:hypothetical protein
MPSSRAPFASGLMKEYGNYGLPPNAVSSCGWLLTTEVGQLTDWPGEAFPTQTDVCCVTRMRTFSTFSFGVCLLDSSGTPSCNMLVFLRLPHSLLNHPSMTGGRRWNLLLVVMHEKA